MASEEQYLDDLLKNVIGDEPPKERTMQDVMREIGVDYNPEPENESKTPDTDPNIVLSDPVSASDDIPAADIPGTFEEIPVADTSDSFEDIPVADTSDSFETEPVDPDNISQEDSSNLTFPDQDVLADMLDILDDPASFANETQTVDTTEEEISRMLEDVPGIIDESDVPAETDPLQDDLESMLDGIEETFNSEEIPAEEPASQDDLAAMLEGMGGDDPNAKMSPDDIAAMFAAAEGATAADEETPAEETLEEAPAEEAPVEEASVEEAAAEEIPLEEIPAEEPASQDDLAAMLEGMGGDDPNAKMSPDDIAAMFAAAEGATAADEETPAEETPAEETPVEETPADEALTEEAPAEETSDEDGVMMSSDDELLKMLGEATTAEDFVMPEDRLAKAEDSDISVEENEADAATENAEIDENNLSQSDIEALMAGEPLGMPSGDSQEDLEALLAMAGEGADEPSSETQDDLEAMLAAAGEGSEESATGETAPDGDLSQDDLEAMLGGIDTGETAESSEELSDVEKLEATEGSDEDLLSLLEGIDDTPEEERGLDGLPDELSGVLGEEEDDQAKPKKKKFSLLSLLPFGKKKKKDEEEVKANWDEIDGEPDSDQPIEAAAEQIDDILAGIENEGEEAAPLAAGEGEISEDAPEAGEKKKGFFAKILSFLFDEEEEEEIPPEEVSNDDILAQIDAENAEEDAKGKKGKKGKKDKKKKGKKAEGEEGEGSSEESEEGGDDSKKKKKKKEKAPKEPKEPKEKEPRKVVLSKKAFIALVALCASIIAAIVILSNLLPDHADKAAARRAYFQGDYRAVYDKLHDKNLGDSDYLLYKKAETVLLLQRRIDSYRNRIKLNEPAQALDSLLEGVHLYDVLSEGDNYNVKSELVPLYEQILEILGSEYGIDHDEAVRLYSIEDRDVYTEELIKIISRGNYIIERPGNNPAPVTDEESVFEDAESQLPPPDRDTNNEMPLQEPNPDEMVPMQDDTAPGDEPIFEELHPMEDLLEAEEDL